MSQTTVQVPFEGPSQIMGFRRPPSLPSLPFMVYGLSASDRRVQRQLLFGMDLPATGGGFEVSVAPVTKLRKKEASANAPCRTESVRRGARARF